LRFPDAKQIAVEWLGRKLGPGEGPEAGLGPLALVALAQR
jgi:hypothetical protein